MIESPAPFKTLDVLQELVLSTIGYGPGRKKKKISNTGASEIGQGLGYRSGIVPTWVLFSIPLSLSGGSRTAEIDLMVPSTGIKHCTDPQAQLARNH